VKQGVLDCVGNTPLLRIKSLSDATGCEILAKAEFLNPGGSIKDRIALHIVRKAAERGLLFPGALITEATAGSTGVSLAMVAAASGYKCVSI
jgi:cysteine synthase